MLSNPRWVLEEKQRADLFSVLLFPRSLVQPYWTYDAGRTGKLCEVFAGCCVPFAWITLSCVLAWPRTERGLWRKEKRKRSGKMRKCAERPKETGKSHLYLSNLDFSNLKAPLLISVSSFSECDPASPTFGRFIGQKAKRKGQRVKESCNPSGTCCQRWANC